MRIALAYSGSLEGSAAIEWLRDRHAAEIVAVTLDLGQGRALEAIRDRALALGAQRAHVLDTRELFAASFIVPALRADALHDGVVPMALALSRPLIAQQLVEIARIERADAVAHTGEASGGASQLDRLVGALAPALPILTPAREWTLDRAALAAFGRRHGLDSTADDGARVETNVWGRSVSAGGVDPHGAPAHGTRPAEAALVDVTFTRGIPTALNGVPLSLIELVGSLGTLASTHGVGRTRSDALSCEAPAAVVLHAAHRELTRTAADADVGQFSTHATAAYTRIVEGARWFSPLREALDACFISVQARVNGHVRLRLLNGEHEIVSAELSDPASGTPLLRMLTSPAQH